MNPIEVPPNGVHVDARQKDMSAEIDRLRTSLQDAEQRIAELQKQRDKYYEFTKLWIEQNCPLSDWDDFDPAEYIYDFKDLLAEVRTQYNV